MKERLILCVTGRMAAGKNAAQDILVAQGFVAVDADLLVHDAVEIAKSQILETFSDEALKNKINLLNNDGTVNRRELGRLIFKDENLLEKQERIIHPAVDKLIKQFVEEHANQSIVINATVLFKTTSINICDAIIFVDAPFFLRVIRAKKRDGMPLKQIFARFRSQKQLFSQYKKCDADIYRVSNCGRREDLQKKLCKIVHKCLQKEN